MNVYSLNWFQIEYHNWTTILKCRSEHCYTVLVCSTILVSDEVQSPWFLNASMPFPINSQLELVRLHWRLHNIAFFLVGAVFTIKGHGRHNFAISKELKERTETWNNDETWYDMKLMKYNVQCSSRYSICWGQCGM